MQVKQLELFEFPIQSYLIYKGNNVFVVNAESLEEAANILLVNEERWETKDKFVQIPNVSIPLFYLELPKNKGIVYRN